MLSAIGSGNHLKIFDQFIVDRSLPKYNEKGETIISNEAAGTFIMMKDPETNKLHPVYCEPNMTVTPFKLPARCVQQ